MDTLISFDDLKAGAKALKKLAQAFMRAGTPVAATDVDPKTKRTSGINFRQVLLTFADNQKVQLGIKTTGDIFEVKVNGSVLPIKAQDDQRKAVGEIVKALDAGRAKFQAKLARQKVALPKGITTAAPKMEQKLAQASSDLDAQITTAKARVNELRAELGEPVLDSVGGLKPGIYVRFKDGSEPVFLGASMSAAKAKYDQWANRGKGAKLLDKEYETRKKLHWVERSYGLDVEGREAWANMDLTDSMLDSAGAAVLDAAKKGELIEVYQRGTKGPIYILQADRIKDPRFIPVRDSKGKATGKEVHQDNLYASQKDADAANDRVKRRLGVLDDAERTLDAVDVPTNTFDNPDVLAAQQIAQQVNSGMALDDAAFPHALATLYIALDTVETNHPINLAEGDLAQAELEERAAEDFRAAIKVLEGQQVAA